MFVENSPGRARAYYRITVIKGAKADTFDRTTIFNGDSTNKMMDGANTERFTGIAHKIAVAMLHLLVLLELLEFLVLPLLLQSID
jgi:hypothetical protein